MPISRASYAIAPRIARASSTSSVSASGSPAEFASAFTVGEPRLENRLCRDLVANGALPAAVHAGFVQALRRFARGQALVDQFDGQSEAGFEPSREAPGAGGHCML